MKKLEKLKLHDATILNDNDMKNVVGGANYYGTSGYREYRCTIYNREYPNVTTTVVVQAPNQADAMKAGRAAFIATGYSASAPVLDTMQCN